MTIHRDPDARIAAYLADGMEILPDRVADAVMGEIHRTRQRAVLGPWRTRSVLKAVLGAAAVFAVLVFGGTLYLQQRGQPAVVGGPSPSVVPARASSWTPTGDMATDRSGHTATLLPDGRLLVVGGVDGRGYLASAELYDPAVGTWITTGTMLDTRSCHTATRLPGGTVLVAGGQSGSGDLLASVEVYDPASGTWKASGSMAEARCGHTATRLPSGKVLVAGGVVLRAGSPSGSLASAELYDPTSGTWATTGTMLTSREGHTATLLPDGRVLVAFGANGDNQGNVSATAELYDPASGTWTATGSTIVALGGPMAALLPNGKVLVVGVSDVNTGTRTAELYDPGDGTWAVTGSWARANSFSPLAYVLLSGKVLVVNGPGGIDDTLATPASLYDPAGGTWSATAAMTSRRGNATGSLLADGRVLLAGGFIPEARAALPVPDSSAELYDPGSP